jgi:hypothetical protein
MLGSLGRHVRSNVVGYVAIFLALGGTTYAATGGNFILGQSNTAGAPTQLSSGTTNTAGAFKVTNTKTGRAISAVGTSGGFGVWASGGQHSRNTAAVHGQSGGGNAVEGFSTASVGSGVYGQNNNAASYGVAGHSDNGVAVVGDSASGWAFQALGNTSQTRTGNGFVKEMAHVDPAAGDPIGQCFNSQLPPGQATAGDCGISIDTNLSSLVGITYMNLGFTVTDRFISASPNRDVVFSGGTFPDPHAVPTIDVSPGGPSTDVIVQTVANGAYVDVPFWIIVY